MTTSIRTLPIVEKWDCHGCGRCCRGSTIPLDENDLQKLAEQRWEDHPDFCGVRTVVRERLWRGRRVLAKRTDGYCVFFSPQGRCHIHELFGADAKPAVCRLYPLQVVPLGKFAYLTSRRSCPSAAADRGRPVEEHVGALKKSGLLDQFTPDHAAPPAIVRGVRATWPDSLATADALSRLLTDQQLPLVRRVVHGLQFCELLGQCKLRKVRPEAWCELMQMLETSTPESAAEYFRDRQPPSRRSEALLRQIAVHYLRSHPEFPATMGTRQGWRLLQMSATFARGKGRVPPLLPGAPAATFTELQRPLGPLPEKTTQPLNRYFETHALSKQYTKFVPRQSLVESFRALALTFPMALWLLRLVIGDRPPETDDMLQIVVTLERGQGLSAAARAATALADTQQLQRLVAWYAR